MIKFRSAAEKGYITALFSAVLMSLFTLIICGAAASYSYGHNSYAAKEPDAAQTETSDSTEISAEISDISTDQSVSGSETETDTAGETSAGEASETEGVSETEETTGEPTEESGTDTVPPVFPGQNNNHIGNIAGEIKDEITGSRALALIGIILAMIIAVAVILLIILLLQRREFKELPAERRRTNTDETKDQDKENGEKS